MVAKIKSGKSLKGALMYNEIKVGSGKAVMLEARGYHKDTAKLSFQDKLFRLRDLAERNHRVRTNTVHISLNFDVGEKLSAEKLVAVADRYMEGIGFGDQPYLVYQHFDAGHPHLHLVTTNIDRDGTRISLHNLGKTKSEATRKAIEVAFNLTKAEDARVAPQVKIGPVRYGETDSKRAIANVVRAVIHDYKFTSLGELNAVLQQYQVLADPGSKNSLMYKNAGLRYWITDARGTKLGVPIKASNLPGKPIMKLLRRRFLLNKALRSAKKEAVRLKVDRALSGSTSIASFQEVLQKLNVRAVIRRTDTGAVYGLTFVDNDLKMVFNGSDLGKAYAAAGITGRFKTEQVAERSITDHSVTASDGNELIDALFAPTQEEASVPGELRQKRKKKRRLNL
jgi:hypothetical protein